MTQAREFEQHLDRLSRSGTFNRSTFAVFEEIEKFGAKRLSGSSFRFLPVEYEFPDGSVMNFSIDGGCYYTGYSRREIK